MISHEAPGQWLKEGARWLLLGIMVYAPLAFGCTRPEFKEGLRFALLALGGLFLLRLVVGRKPRVPALALAITIAILAYGWFSVLNARQEFDPLLHRFFDLPDRFSGLPGTVDRATSLPHMLLVSGLVVAFWVACDANGHPLWRDRLWKTVCLTGCAAMIFGLFSRLCGFDAALFQSGYPFAPYPYHGNAGAFINIVLPFIFYRALESFDHPAPFPRAFWSLAALLTASCGFVNASRAGSTITVLLLCGFGIERLLRAKNRERRLAAPIGIGMAMFALVAVLGWSLGLDQALTRWLFLGQQLSSPGQDARVLVYQALWENALPLSGWWGLGPGTFQITFPFFCNEPGSRIAGIWRYAHEDYLQTLLEWGVVGTSLWVVLIGGGVAAGFTGARRAAVSRLETAALFALAGVCIHALVDFPLQIASIQLYVAITLAVLWSAGDKTGA